MCIKIWWFKKEHLEQNLFKNCVEGELAKREDRLKTKFHGVYLIIDSDDETLYVGSASAKTFNISDRLRGQLNGDKTDSSFKNCLVKSKGISFDEAGEYAKKCKFIVIQCESFEYFFDESYFRFDQQKRLSLIPRMRRYCHCKGVQCIKSVVCRQSLVDIYIN